MGSYAPPLWLSVYIVIWNSSAQEVCLFLPKLCIYLIIHLYQYGLMNIYFIFWIISHHLFFIQIVLVLAFGSSFSRLVGHNPIFVGFCFLFEHFLTFWHYQDALGSFVCFLSQSLDLTFLQGVLILLIGEQY